MQASAVSGRPLLLQLRVAGSSWLEPATSPRLESAAIVGAQVLHYGLAELLTAQTAVRDVHEQRKLLPTGGDSTVGACLAVAAVAMSVCVA